VSVKSGLPHFRELANILKLVEDKTLQVIIDRSFPLTEARAAQRHLEAFLPPSHRFALIPCVL
jgi:NADPH:quinone reductase-like Zn-dependent oxidoreductase